MSEHQNTHCGLNPEPILSSSATIIDKNGAGLIVFGKHGLVQFANKAAGKLLGRPLHELLGKSPDFPWAENNGGEFLIHRQDSETMAIEVRMLEMEWGGEIARLAFLQDITDRRCTEEALKSAILKVEDEKARTDAVIAAIGDGISIHDRDFKIVYQNQIYKDLVGEHLGEYCYKAYARKDAVCEYCHMKISFLDGGIHTVEKRFASSHGMMYFEITVSPLKNAQGEVIAGIEVIRNVTKRKQTEEKIQFMISHDILTGLYNRFYFEQELARLERGRRFPLSIVMADLDGLKSVNDTLGHAEGDTLLRQTAILLQEVFRGEDVVARFGGDEFAMLLPDTDELTVQEVVSRIRENLRSWNETHSIPINLSLGIATAENGQQLPEALKTADRCMYQNKHSRTGRHPRRTP